MAQYDSGLARDADRADKLGRVRVWIYLVYAAILVGLEISQITLVNKMFTRGLWLGMAAVMALALTPWLWKWLWRFKFRGGLAALFNDESTQAHRHMACTAGFSAALVAGFAVYVLQSLEIGVPAVLATQATLTAALVAALVSFAVNEWRALR